MSLKAKVIAGNITNLSNARYCAGMGVDIIGFPIGNNGHFGYDTSQIKEIINWLSGIKIALEIKEEDSNNFHKIEKIIEDIKPDYIQIPSYLYEEYKNRTKIDLLILVDSYSQIGLIHSKDYLIYTGKTDDFTENLIEFCLRNKVYILVSKQDFNNINKIINTLNPYGIALMGENEISPGLKNFNEFDEIFDFLEE